MGTNTSPLRVYGRGCFVAEVHTDQAPCPSACGLTRARNRPRGGENPYEEAACDDGIGLGPVWHGRAVSQREPA
jgi:hypothetical protein